jgi:hypothetical protein
MTQMVNEGTVWQMPSLGFVMLEILKLVIAFVIVVYREQG